MKAGIIITISLLVLEISSQSNMTAQNSDVLVKQLMQLIEKYSAVIDFEADRELYQNIISKFRLTLLQLCTINNDSLLIMNILNEAILGSFRMKGYSIKYQLSEGKQTIHRKEFNDIPHWNMDLVHEIISLCFDANTEISGQISPIELAIKLQMFNVVSLLVENGVQFCSSFLPLKCNDALHYAVTNQDIEGIELIISVFLTQTQKYATKSKHTLLCLFLTRESIVFKKSSLEISYIHCISILSCRTYYYLIGLADCNTSNDLTCVHHNSINVDINNEEKKSCRQINFLNYVSVMQNDGRACCINCLSSGWKIYDGFRVGKDDCDLPRVKAIELSSNSYCTSDFSIPLIIEGVSKHWTLNEEWKKQNLLNYWHSVDVMVSSIPYGEVFGEKFGYATIKEFISYMDEYAKYPSFQNKLKDFRAPLYVFDNEVLLKYFNESYNLNDLQRFFRLEMVTNYPQFILGPAGSGAPFHFHCPAINALIYGRKKWFLYPPGQALYSKKHPLLWYMEEYSNLGHKPVECIQRPGDILYVPAGWSHATVNLDECIGLAVEFNIGNC